MRKLIWFLLVIFLFAARCSKEEIPAIKTDDNGVIISQPFKWRYSLHASGVFYSNGYFEPAIIFNNNIAIPTTGTDGTQYMTMINTSSGELLWQWNDVFPDISGELEFFRHHIYNNLLTWQQGSRSYCVNLEKGTTHWKIQRDKTYENRIHPYGNVTNYFTYSLMTNTNGYDEGVAYLGNIQTGALTEFLRANYSGDYIGPITENGGIGAIIYINEVQSNSNLVLVTYAEPLPEWCVNSFLGLYNTQTKEWVYERKLMVSPLWNTSVFHMPIIYDDKVYANVGNNLVCHDLYTGEQVWRKEFNNDFFFSGFIIEEDKIIANNENLTLYCLDPESGSELWSGEGHMRQFSIIIYYTIKYKM